jgi:hypothetical protein
MAKKIIFVFLNVIRWLYCPAGMQKDSPRDRKYLEEALNNQKSLQASPTIRIFDLNFNRMTREERQKSESRRMKRRRELQVWLRQLSTKN